MTNPSNLKLRDQLTRLLFSFITALLIFEATVLSTLAQQPDGKIVFSSARDGNGSREIYVMNADGTNQVRLTNNAVWDDFPEWSPDGQKIAFLSHTPDGIWAIFTMNKNGTGRTVVTQANALSLGTRISWSPDGKRIAFESFENDNESIVIVNTDGTNRQVITNGAYPSWSPDGSKILFTPAGGGVLKTIRPDGSDLRLVNLEPNADYNGSASRPRWSPDGQHMIFDSQDPFDTFMVFTVRADGTDLRYVVGGAFHEGHATSPDWSPDGGMFVYDFEGSGIYKANIDGSGKTRLTNGDNYHPSWQRNPAATVTNTNDSGAGSLRQAIIDAAPGDTISFSVTGTITLTSGQLVIDKNLTIQGPGAGLLSISGNHASRVFRIATGVTATLDGLTIKDGAVSIDGGGGIYNGGTLTVSNSSITGNATTASAVHGGGILNAGTLNLNRSTVSGNVAGNADGFSNGGGITSGGVMNITDSTVSANSSDYGGGLTNYGTTTVINSTISGNAVDGIFNFGTLTVSYSSISGNTTDKFGSGISNRGVAVVTTSTISYNIGEGIFSSGTMTVANSTLSGNTTGIRFSPSDSGRLLTVINSTVFGNLGIGIYNGNGFGNAVTLMNTIVAGNSVAGSAGDIYGTAIGSASHNLIGDAASSGGILNGVNGNIVGVNPLLGPLRNNGGPTMTHALRPASPEINTGDNCVLTQNGCGYGNPALTTDQRGMPRNGMVDIGAFERQLVESSSSAPFDYDGDGKTDISVHRWTTRTWYVARSLTNDMYVKPFSVDAETMMPADYDGDGKTDIAFSSEFNPPENYMALVILNSSTNTVSVRPFDAYGLITLAADFDGDGRADPTTWSGFGSWKIDMSQSGTVYTQQWGVAGDKAVPADFDGDGRAELAVWRPSEGKWYVANIATGSITTINWGVDGDIPVPGDYSGDGRADFAVYRPSNNTWYQRHSSDDSMHTKAWGAQGDIPAPGDYDGDRRMDLTVFRPSEGKWYIFTATNTIITSHFGQDGDTPTPGAFIY